jgi:hypothetical protein
MTGSATLNTGTWADVSSPHRASTSAVSEAGRYRDGRVPGRTIDWAQRHDREANKRMDCRRFLSFQGCLVKGNPPNRRRAIYLQTNAACSNGFRDIVFPQSGAYVRIHSKKFIDFQPPGDAIVPVHHSCAISEK